jgi:chemotaxis protein MotB
MGWKSVRERELETEAERLKGYLAQSEKSKQEMLQSMERLQTELARVQDERAQEIKRLMEEREKTVRRVVQEKDREGQDLLLAQQRLAESLKEELADARAKLSMTERGLVVTFLDEIFFDSGKAEIKPDGGETLGKLAEILKGTVPDSPVAVEGHTDNQPIRHSGWKSNWELSSARALAVVHNFIDKNGMPAKRLRSVGFGEHHPVSPNETAEGRRQNRRVEVVILPPTLKKAKPGDLASSAP